MTDFGRRAAVAAVNVLPKTGLETSYRDGDDGYYEKGWEGDRFTDNGDGTITDNATGLMWPKDWHGAGANNQGTLNWESAIDWANVLSFAGYEDWRIPNKLEIASLIYSENVPPGTYPAFDNADLPAAWSSTTQAQLSGNKIITVFVEGVGSIWTKTSLLPVLAVRTV